MNLELLSSDIASRIPEMARDSALNNAQTIKGIIQQYQKKEVPVEPVGFRTTLLWIAAIAWTVAAVLAIFIPVANSLNQPKPIIYVKPPDRTDPGFYVELYTPRYITNTITLTNTVSNGPEWSEVGFREGIFYAYHSLKESFPTNATDFYYNALKLRTKAELLADDFRKNKPQ